VDGASGSQIPLFRRIPGLAGKAARIPFGSYPTPVERLRIGAPGGEGMPEDLEVWVKRDDLTGEEYGGNKVRKLEFLLADARARDAGRVITAGALGSHHALATAVYGRRVGLPVTLVLSPQRPTEHVREVLLADHALGAELRLVRRMELIPWGLLKERFRLWRKRPYTIRPGGSDALGTLGYVNAALELLDQVEAGVLPMPRNVHVACGTMGTAGGLALGFALGGARVRIHAIRVVSPLVTNRRGLGRLLRSTAAVLESGGEPDPPLEAALRSIRLRHDQIGDGYGKPTDAGSRAGERMASAGFPLDPTYTAKAAAGLLASLEEGEAGPHLYWHTLSHGMPPTPSPDPKELPKAFRPFFEDFEEEKRP